jgi:putative transposase
MPFWRLYYHLIWATKNRLPLIDADLEARLFLYLRQKAGELDCQVYALNGWVDHVHIVMTIPPSRSVSEVVKGLKGASSHEFTELKWQRGYGILSIGERHLAVAVVYVEKQKEHHQDNLANTWLETVDDEKERDSGSEQQIRETGAGYEVWDDVLF